MRTSRKAPGRPAAVIAVLLALSPLAAGADAPSKPLAGDRPLERMAESSDLRAWLWDSLLSAPKAAALAYRASEQRNAWGLWSVRVERKGGAFYAVIAPNRDGDYPVYAQGSWVIKRSESDGSFLQAKVFLRSDSGTFARVFPAGGRSRLDVVAYGGVLCHDVMVPLPFEELLVSPFSRVMALTADVVDWGLFSPDPALYGDARRFLESVRSRLPGLRYADDGALDADGRAVLIDSLRPQSGAPGLNCSGFAKWLADGVRAPLSGDYLAVEGLKVRMLDARGSSFTEKFEESLDPFFALDWSRALAAATWASFYPSRPAEPPKAYDVSEPPFALIVSDSDPVNGGSAYETYADNFDDAGIGLRGLKSMLFLLASREPGRFYLASFNARDRDPPNLRRYFHIAALVPYFDEDGVFRVAVFESAAETSLERVMSDRDYEYVKLVRMPLPGRFQPQALP